MASAAKPLKIPASAPAKPSSTSTTPTAPTPTPASGSARSALPTTNAAEITSPHELTAFVETLLERLDSKFDDMSSQFLDRMNQMSNRVDKLEASIQDIINGDFTGPSMPQSPTPGAVNGGLFPPTSGIKKSFSGP